MDQWCLSAATCIMIFLCSNSISANQRESGHITKDVTKRGLLTSLGNKAVKVFLSGAVRRKNNPPKEVISVKLGGYKGANDDYSALSRSTYRQLKTDQGTKRGKLVGDRFFQKFFGSSVDPPRIEINQVRYTAGKENPSLKNPIVIEYLQGTGHSFFRKNINSKQQ